MQNQRCEMQRSPIRQEFRVTSPSQFAHPIYPQYPAYQYPYPYQPMGIAQPFYPPPIYNYQMPICQMGMPSQPVYIVYPQNPRLDTDEISDDIYSQKKNMVQKCEETQKASDTQNFDAYRMPISSPIRERREPNLKETYGFPSKENEEILKEQNFKTRKELIVEKNHQPEILIASDADRKDEKKNLPKKSNPDLIPPKEDELSFMDTFPSKISQNNPIDDRPIKPHKNPVYDKNKLETIPEKGMSKASNKQFLKKKKVYDPMESIKKEKEDKKKAKTDCPNL